MLMRLAVVAVAVALSAGAWSSGGIGAGIGTVLVAQVPWCTTPLRAESLP